MNLRSCDALPPIVTVPPRVSVWYPLLDEFDRSGAEYAEVVEHGYNDAWQALEYGAKALAGREMVSGYLRKFRLVVLDSRLFIVRR